MDGGFLQVMMMTRGRGEMERLVVEEGPQSVGEIKGSLAGLKVRLGEVEFREVGGEVRRRLAFRTEGEGEVVGKG